MVFKAELKSFLSETQSQLMFTTNMAVENTGAENSPLGGNVPDVIAFSPGILEEGKTLLSNHLVSSITWT